MLEGWTANGLAQSMVLGAITSGVSAIATSAATAVVKEAVISAPPMVAMAAAAVAPRVAPVVASVAMSEVAYVTNTVASQTSPTSQGTASAAFWGVAAGLSDTLTPGNLSPLAAAGPALVISTGLEVGQGLSSSVPEPVTSTPDLSWLYAYDYQDPYYIPGTDIWIDPWF